MRYRLSGQPRLLAQMGFISAICGATIPQQPRSSSPLLPSSDPSSAIARRIEIGAPESPHSPRHPHLATSAHWHRRQSAAFCRPRRPPARPQPRFASPRIEQLNNTASAPTVKASSMPAHAFLSAKQARPSSPVPDHRAACRIRAALRRRAASAVTRASSRLLMVSASQTSTNGSICVTSVARISRAAGHRNSRACRIRRQAVEIPLRAPPRRPPRLLYPPPPRQLFPPARQHRAISRKTFRARWNGTTA